MSELYHKDFLFLSSRHELHASGMKCKKGPLAGFSSCSESFEQQKSCKPLTFQKRFTALFTRVCLKKAFCKMCVTICGRFCSDEGVIASYDNRIRAKYTAKSGMQIAGMIFQTRSNIFERIWSSNSVFYTFVLDHYLSS